MSTRLRELEILWNMKGECFFSSCVSCSAKQAVPVKVIIT